MLKTIEDNATAIEALCQRYGVARLEVFGSAATGEFDPARSDLDFLLVSGDIDPRDRFTQFFELQRALSELLRRPVDLVETGAMRNPFFIRRVNETRRLVYPALPDSTQIGPYAIS